MRVAAVRPTKLIGGTVSRTVPGLNATALGEALVDALQSRGIGAMAKREIDALLLYLLEQHSTVGSMSNHEAGLLLRAPASRIRTLRQEAMYRFVEDLPKLASEHLLMALRTSRYDGNSDALTLVVEDALGRDALLAELKAGKSYGVSNPGNSEVIEASSDAVIDLLERSLPDDERERFLKTVNKGRPNLAKKTFKEVMRAVFDEIKSRGTGAIVDLAKDQVGKHIGDLKDLIPWAVMAIKALA
jgi:hypothetical protein